ncbi:hypothetical protein KR093_008350, partial [Drosophila rubida]
QVKINQNFCFHNYTKMDVNKELLVKLLAELLASFCVQFAGCCVACPVVSYLPYAVAWGGAVVAATQAFRIVSGAHISPCITIAALIMEKLGIIESLLYVFMQLVGSALGFGFAYGFVRHKNSIRFCVTQITIHPWWKAILLEFYMTGAWVLAMCSSWNVANENMLESISLRIGIVVTASTLAGGGHTGASMNPFRSLWPAIADGYWTHFYVFFLVPPITAALLALAWRYLFLQGDIEQSNEGA